MVSVAATRRIAHTTPRCGPGANVALPPWVTVAEPYTTRAEYGALVVAQATATSTETVEPGCRWSKRRRWRLGMPGVHPLQREWPIQGRTRAAPSSPAV